MSSTDERMVQIQKRAEAIQKQNEREKSRGLVAAAYLVCIGLIVASSYFLAEEAETSLVQAPAGSVASTFAMGSLWGYVSVGIVAFLLGVSVTLLCRVFREKRREEDEEDGAGR